TGSTPARSTPPRAGAPWSRRSSPWASERTKPRTRGRGAGGRAGAFLTGPEQKTSSRDIPKGSSGRSSLWEAHPKETPEGATQGSPLTLHERIERGLQETPRRFARGARSRRSARSARLGESVCLRSQRDSGEPGRNQEDREDRRAVEEGADARAVPRVAREGHRARLHGRLLGQPRARGLSL